VRQAEAEKVKKSIKTKQTPEVVNKKAVKQRKSKPGDG
jgi:hypothetical protein